MVSLRYPTSFTVLAAALFTGACAPTSAAQAPPAEGPRLGVLLVVDQLPAYLVDRYDDVFTGGLRRLFDQGRVFTQATHDYAVTETAPGHATLATGTFPAAHGVVSNQWYERRENGQWTSVLNVVDLDTRIVGAPNLAGASPVTLRREGLADWLVAAHDDARVVSVSGKDRAAVLLAGRTRGRVAWFEPELGRFATSTFYAADEPAWLTAYNEGALQTHRADTVWASRVPPALADRSRPDTAHYEGDGVLTAFPHRYADARLRSPDLGFWTWWANTPFLDRATLNLARAAVEAEGLGSDDVSDLLAISLSQADRVGHAYGPLSREQLDNLQRLDAELASFFAWLDDTVGADAWVVAFSSDHGVLEVPEARAATGRPGVRLTADSVRTLRRILDDASADADGDQDRMAGPLLERLPRVGWIARAWATTDLLAMEPAADSFAVLERRSVFAGRPQGILSRAGVEIQFQPFTLHWGYTHGTSHGSPYLYDRHVPLIFMGSGVAAGTDPGRVSTVDVAPTLAGLMGIPFPDDLDGVPRTVR